MRAVAAMVGLLAACGGSARAPVPAPATANAASTDGRDCPADELGEAVESVPPSCDGEECRELCDGGDVVACIGLAYLLERDDATRTEASSLYRRACLAGVANACTNYGSHLLDTDPACAYRLHTWTCAAGEHYGCGMIGHELIEGLGVARDLDAARAHLDRTCASPGGFACNVLGYALERGTFGTPDRDAALELYQRGCDTGDVYSCSELERLSGE